MDLIQLDIVGLSNSQTQSGAFALVLGEVVGKRRLPIVIGSFEAKAIAIALDKEYKSQRPITHDLFLHLCNGFNIIVRKIVISSINSTGIFSSIIYCVDSNGKELELDSRTSDAVAIAIRFKAPIFTYDAIINEAGILLDKDVIEEVDKEEDIKEVNKGKFYSTSLEELQKQLSQAILNEDYEAASELRDEIKNREK
jgi:uncharacterized protein